MGVGKGEGKGVEGEGESRQGWVERMGKKGEGRGRENGGGGGEEGRRGGEGEESKERIGPGEEGGQGGENSDSGPLRRVAQPTLAGIGRWRVRMPRPRGAQTNSVRGRGAPRQGDQWRRRGGAGRCLGSQRARASPQLEPRPRSVPAVLTPSQIRPCAVPAPRTLRAPARGALGRSGHSPRPWPPGLTRRRAAKRTTGCATTARQ